MDVKLLGEIFKHYVDEVPQARRKCRYIYAHYRMPHHRESNNPQARVLG